MKINDATIKKPVNREKRVGIPIYPYNFLSSLPDCECVFDSYRGTIGFDVFPFAITTKVSSACEVFLKVYEEDNVGRHKGKGSAERG